MLIPFAGICQTIALSDDNFREKLKVDYPQVMDGEELDIAAAGALTGTLDLSYSDINDVSGLELFTSLSTINLNQNNLTTIPDISATVGLMNLFANHNELDTLPSLASLVELRDFQVMNNRLVYLPDLDGANLSAIYCSQNRLADFPDLNDFPNLKYLVIGSNQLTKDLDYSLCPKLKELHVHNLGINQIIGLSTLSDLNTLFAWGNEINDFSGLNGNTKMETIVIFDNPLIELPQLTDKPNLNWLDIGGCQLSFEDIYPVFTKPLPSKFSYSGQARLSFLDQQWRQKNNETLSYPISQPNDSNVYVWLKDGEVIDSARNAHLNFESVQDADSGAYQLKVYNALMPQLVLESEVFNVQVSPCLEFSLPSVEIADQDCSKGYTIDLSNAEIVGDNGPFRYILNDGVVEMESNEMLIEGVPSGEYTLSIVDTKSCEVSQSLRLNRIEGCDPVISPNGDGVADSYFLEHQGFAKIYNTNRELVNTLEGPISWGGTDLQGVLLDAGYYIIVQDNQEPVHITIVR